MKMVIILQSGQVRELLVDDDVDVEIINVDELKAVGFTAREVSKKLKQVSKGLYNIS